MLGYKQAFEKYFEDNFEEILASLGEIIAIRSVAVTDSVVKPFGEGSARALKWGQEQLEKLGMKTVNVDGYAVHGDYMEGEPALTVLSHLDTVPEGEGWSFPPFELTQKDGVLYGRGTIDDKGPSVAVLYAIKAIRDLNIPIKRNFRVVFGGFEEGGCEDIAYYKSKYKLADMVFTPDGSFPVLNCEKGLIHLTFSGNFPQSEKGVVTLKAGTVINAVPGRAELVLKGISAEQLADALPKGVTLEAEGERCVITGRSAHGSRPENGTNTATAIAEAFTKLNTPQFERISKLFVHGDMCGKALGLGFSDEISGEMTCVLTQLEISGDKLTAGVDIRFPIDRKSSEIIGIIAPQLAANGFEITSSDCMEPHYVDKDSKLVQTLLKVYEGVSGEKGECIAEGGVTYVHDVEGGVAFGAEFPWENNNMHGADEHISVETFKANLNMYANAIVELTSGE